MMRPVVITLAGVHAIVASDARAAKCLHEARCTTTTTLPPT
jgi:hypothetical protein